MPSQRRSYVHHPPAAKPRRDVFDPWNSSSSGHQTSNSVKSNSSYQKARERWLNTQLQNKPPLSNVQELALVQNDRLSSLQQKQPDEAELRIQSQKPDHSTQQDRTERIVNNQMSRCPVRLGSMTSLMPPDTSIGCRMEDSIVTKVSPVSGSTDGLSYKQSLQPDGEHGLIKQPTGKSSRIFHGCKFYINGSTAPFISDHKLKSLIAKHGGLISVALRRREVTHVVLNERKGSESLCHQLSSRKMQSEIQKAHAGLIKYITVDWILRSIKAGRKVQTKGLIPIVDKNAGAGGPLHKICKQRSTN